MKINIIKLPNNDDLSLPEYATSMSAGMDLIAAVTNDLIVKPGDVMLVPTGIAIALTQGYEAQVRPRSGLALKHQITVLNSPGTIDADYRGEIKVMLINLGKLDFTVTRGMRIAQMVVARHEKVEWDKVDSLDITERNQGGFGSTGS